MWSFQYKFLGPSIFNSNKAHCNKAGSTHPDHIMTKLNWLHLKQTITKTDAAITQTLTHTRNKIYINGTVLTRANDKFVLMRILIFVVSKCHTWHVLISDKLHSDFRWKPVTRHSHDFTRHQICTDKHFHWNEWQMLFLITERDLSQINLFRGSEQIPCCTSIFYWLLPVIKDYSVICARPCIEQVNCIMGDGGGCWCRWSGG